jgi:polyisoprenyl-phosphate glycosyltransferase
VTAPEPLHSIALVVPVYQGERTLEALLEEVAPLTAPGTTPGGHRFVVTEVVLVHDRGPDRSDEVIRRLASTRPFVAPVWLSRNFGQHAATLAGMASTTADWVATLDEDGQQDPRDVARLLDSAMAEQAPLVYGRPTNPPPHGALRNLASGVTKGVIGAWLGVPRFNSFRLVLGELARGVAAYCGSGVYLDVALSWVVDRVALCPVALRAERGRSSGYTARRLLSHLWTMVLSSGTRPLRAVAVVGALLGAAAAALMGWVVWAKWTGRADTSQGWASLMVVLLAASSVTMLALGVLAEYMGLAVRMAMGRPLYLVVSDPAAPAASPTPTA